MRRTLLVLAIVLPGLVGCAHLAPRMAEPDRTAPEEHRYSCRDERRLKVVLSTVGGALDGLVIHQLLANWGEGPNTAAGQGTTGLSMALGAVYGLFNGFLLAEQPCKPPNEGSRGT